ncbi:MAG TPA: hypothetical protein PKG60_07995 [Spirochaetota bacterium]|nr:hypothetical protein [Spirochaetota bacterium]
MHKGTIYIAGVDHLIQYRNGIVPEYLFDEFYGFFINLIWSYNITAVAEEFNREYLEDVYFSPEATVESAAVKSGVAHFFCDPGKDERLRMGIPYFADIRNMIKKKYGIHEKFISDRIMRGKIEQETIDESKKYWQIREEYWYSIISNIPYDSILFICGHEHVFRFRNLLLRNGRDAEVIESFWHDEIFSDYTKLGIC